MLDNDGNYRFLPMELRDFHDQKDLFKKIYISTDYENIKIDPLYKISWIAMQVNVIDIFLYNMALRGYSLKTDKRFIDKTVSSEALASNHLVDNKENMSDEEVAIIIKRMAEARAMTAHIDCTTNRESEIKNECHRVIMNLLKECDEFTGGNKDGYIQ